MVHFLQRWLLTISPYLTPIPSKRRTCFPNPQLLTGLVIVFDEENMTAVTLPVPGIVFNGLRPSAFSLSVSVSLSFKPAAVQRSLGRLESDEEPHGKTGYEEES